MQKKNEAIRRRVFACLGLGSTAIGLLILLLAYLSQGSSFLAVVSYKFMHGVAGITVNRGDLIFELRSTQSEISRQAAMPKHWSASSGVAFPTERLLQGARANHQFKHDKHWHQYCYLSGATPTAGPSNGLASAGRFTTTLLILPWWLIFVVVAPFILVYWHRKYRIWANSRPIVRGFTPILNHPPQDNPATR